MPGELKMVKTWYIFGATNLKGNDSHVILTRPDDPNVWNSKLFSKYGYESEEAALEAIKQSGVTHAEYTILVFYTWREDFV